MDQVREFMVRSAWIVFAVILIALAVENNVGKGLACIISPGSLEVHDGDTGTQTQDNFSINQSAAADPTQSIRQQQQSSRSI